MRYLNHLLTSLKLKDITKMQTVVFTNINAIYSYYKLRKPAQLKQTSIWKERGNSQEVFISIKQEQLPVDRYALWSLIASNIKKSLKEFPDDKKQIFQIMKLSEYSNEVSVHGLADKFNVSSRTIWNWIKEIEDTCKENFINAGLLEQETNKNV